MGNITSWFFSKLPSPKTPRFVSNCAQSSFTRPVLISIQHIITTLGQQKSSFIGKVKVTLKPISTFLWKNFYSRLCKVLKKMGLFSEEPTLKLLLENHDLLPIPHRKERKLSCSTLPTISEEPTLKLLLENHDLLPTPHRKERKLSCSTLPAISEEPTLKLLLKKLQVTKEEFLNAASDLFRKELIERIQSWEKKISLPENLTQPDLLHALALMGHGVTTDNLNQLLTRVNKGEVPLQLSKKAEDLSQLSTQDIKKLVDFFRNPLEHLLPGEAKILWEELEKVLSPPPKDFDSKRVAYTKYEYHIHKLAEEAKSLTEEEKKLLFLASSEQIAKFAGYAKPDTIQKNMIIPIFTKEHGLIYHKLEDHTNAEGLHCYLFTSINKDLSLPAQLIFRGTDGIESMKRDILDTNGIGKTAFDKYKDQIAKMINTYCEATTKPALEICGHSLGAIDAQRATAFCVELFNEKTTYPSISKLSHISCSAFCSPKLDALTIDQWEKEVNKLKNSILKLQLNFAYHEKDIVTWAGYKNLFIPEDLITQANLQANYLQVTSLSSLLTSTHHRIPFFKGAKFDSTFDNRKCDFYTNTQLPELKEKQAELNALQNEVLIFLSIEDENNNQSIDLSSLERLNIALNSIHESDENEPFVVIDFGENEQALQAIELSMDEVDLLKEKIKNYQKGISSEDSWFIYLLEKLIISPTQATVTRFT